MMSKLYGEHRPSAALPAIALRERPDQALFHLSVAVEAETAAAALAQLKRAAQRLEELLPQQHATLAVTEFRLPHEPGKLESAPASLHATLTVPLPREASAWERAARLAQIDDLLRSLVQEGKKQKPKLEVQRSLPVFGLADPEAHRAALIKRLHDRARSLGGGQPVQLKELRFDQPVEQHSVGLEQVELTLHVGGCAEVQLQAGS
jgi:hypothetical protein